MIANHQHNLSNLQWRLKKCCIKFNMGKLVSTILIFIPPYATMWSINILESNSIWQKPCLGRKRLQVRILSFQPYREITQLVRVLGLYPSGRGFKSYFPYHCWWRYYSKNFGIFFFIYLLTIILHYVILDYERRIWNEND